MRNVASITAIAVTAVLVSAQTPADRAPAVGGNGTESEWHLLPESRLWVEGTSTVQSYTCEAEQLEIRISASPRSAVTSVSQLQAAVQDVDLAVPISALECGNQKMNDHMRNALKAESNPAISFRLTAHDVEPLADGTGRVRMAGDLTIAGQTRPVSMEAEVWLEAAVGLRVIGAADLRMTDFGVRPPRLMLGTLRVHDPVSVRFDMALRP